MMASKIAFIIIAGYLWSLGNRTGFSWSDLVVQTSLLDLNSLNALALRIYRRGCLASPLRVRTRIGYAGCRTALLFVARLRTFRDVVVFPHLSTE